MFVSPDFLIASRKQLGKAQREITPIFAAQEYVIESTNEESKSVAKRLLEFRDRPAQLTVDAEALQTALSDPTDGPLVAGLLLEFPDLAANFSEYFAALPDDDATTRWLAVASTLELPAVDDIIDDWLGDASRAGLAIDALLRAESDWYHPDLVDRLGDKDARFGAAWLLSRSAPEEFTEALEGADSSDEFLGAVRALSLAGDRLWFEPLLQWREDLSDDLEAGELDQIDAALAILDPARYARLLLMGDLEAHWLRDDRTVADFLSVHGTNSWVPSLALFREVRDPEAFELAALFAVSAACADRFDDVDDDALDPGDAARWIDDDPSRVAFQLAVTEDPDLAEHLVETTLHQALLERGLQPPPLTGLPFSGPAPEPDDVSELLKPIVRLSTESPRDRLATVRALTDLHELVRRGKVPRSLVHPLLLRLKDRQEVVDRLVESFDEEKPLANHRDWGCRGLEFALWQLHRPTNKALTDLATGWFSAPPERGALYRAIFAAVLEGINVEGIDENS